MHKRNKKKNMKIIYEKIQFRMRKYIKEIYKRKKA